MCFYAGFAICLYFFYILSPITMKFSSAIVVNLSVLTGNIYNLLWGLFLFDYQVSEKHIENYKQFSRLCNNTKYIDDHHS